MCLFRSTIFNYYFSNIIFMSRFSIFFSTICILFKNLNQILFKLRAMSFNNFHGIFNSFF